MSATQALKAVGWEGEHKEEDPGACEENSQEYE